MPPCIVSGQSDAWYGRGAGAQHVLEAALSGPPSIERNNDGFISRIYSVAVSPERLVELAEAWDQRVRQARGGELDLPLLDRPQLAFHLLQADEILSRLSAAEAPAYKSLTDDLERVPNAAFIVSSAGRITACNAAAQRLGARIDMSVDQLPLQAQDSRALQEIILETLRPGSNAAAPLVRIRMVERDRLLLVQLAVATGGYGERFVVAVASDVLLPAELMEAVRRVFELTGAELATLKQITEGDTVGEIVRRTGRSEATIRGHVQALLSKTGARSQVELVRVTLGLLNALRTEGSSEQRGRSRRLPANHYRVLELPSGRHIEYLLLGDPAGRPFIWLPKNYGMIRWTEAAERALAEKRLCMISTVRAGYGQSAPLPERRSPYDVAVEDLCALVEQLGIASCPWVTLGDDIIIALRAARARPAPVASIIACGSTMPANRSVHYARMPMWPRFIRANARYAPRILPFLLRAGHGLLLRSGGKGFLRAVLRSSPGDLAALEREDVVDALVLNIEVVAPRGRSTLPAYTAEMIEAQENWEPLLAGCRVPLTCFVGRQDPHIPFETLAEYAARYPAIRLVDFPDEGHLAFLTRWRELVALIEAAVDACGREGAADGEAVA